MKEILALIISILFLYGIISILLMSVFMILNSHFPKFKPSSKLISKLISSGMFSIISGLLVTTFLGILLALSKFINYDF